MARTLCILKKLCGKWDKKSEKLHMLYLCIDYKKNLNV